uniref:Uncharacterized protein n=1 Tax=Arundo donax TaxID=35708 RepID=A0A0A9CXG8_ARUDO
MKMRRRMGTLAVISSRKVSSRKAGSCGGWWSAITRARGSSLSP